MKDRKLKTIRYFFYYVAILCVLLEFGCSDGEQNPTCYQGMVVTLNQGEGCNNIIEITEPAKNGELSTGATISFDANLNRGTLEVEDIVSFKIIQYEEWVGPATADCLWPQFTATVEFCSN